MHVFEVTHLLVLNWDYYLWTWLEISSNRDLKISVKPENNKCPKTQINKMVVTSIDNPGTGQIRLLVNYIFDNEHR